jgi:Protein kinase domain
MASNNKVPFSIVSSFRCRRCCILIGLSICGTPTALAFTTNRMPNIDPRSIVLQQPMTFQPGFLSSVDEQRGRTSGRTSSTSTTSLTMSRVPILNEWKVLQNGRVVGTVKNHPSIPDGDIITTSPIQNPATAARRKVVQTISGSKYMLGTPGVRKDSSNKTISIQELQQRAKNVFDLSKDVVGDDARHYLLAGKPTTSTSRKSQIFKAFEADSDGLPQGDPLTVKMSTNWEAIEREADNYAKITKAGLFRGQFVALLDFLPTASVLTKKFGNMSALVMERGVADLKRYIALNGPLVGKELRAAAASSAQCLQAVHGSGLVWTDMKTENFVVMGNGQFKGIDLESAMPVRDSPVDYSPEGTPPEFATAFLAGEGPYFILNYSYDVWSYGMLLYEISTGKGYFDGKTPVQITKALRAGPEIDVRAVPDPQLRNLVAKCLQIDPKKRPGVLQVLLHPYFLSTGFGPLSF